MGHYINSSNTVQFRWFGEGDIRAIPGPGQGERIISTTLEVCQCNAQKIILQDSQKSCRKSSSLFHAILIHCTVQK